MSAGAEGQVAVQDLAVSNKTQKAADAARLQMDLCIVVLFKLWDITVMKTMTMTIPLLLLLIYTNITIFLLLVYTIIKLRGCGSIDGVACCCMQAVVYG